MIIELSNESLIQTTSDLFRRERKGQVEILEHLQEIEARRLYLEKGYPNLYEMCIQEFRCSCGSAQRRIYAMRLMKEVPEVAAKIESGELNLTILSHAQRFFKAEQKELREYTPAEKYELLASFIGKSSREVERILTLANPAIARREHLQVLSPNEVKLTLVVSLALQEKIERLRELTSHANPELKLEGLIESLVDRELRRFGIKAEPGESPMEGGAAVQPVPPKVISRQIPKTGKRKPERTLHVRSRRYVSPQLRREIFQRDGSCAYVDPKTQRRCGSRYFLQVDHIRPLALGGKTERKNLRLLCGSHNRSRPDLLWYQTGLIH